MKLKTILLYFNRGHQSQGPLEGEGVEVVASKYLPGTYFSL